VQSVQDSAQIRSKFGATYHHGEVHDRLPALVQAEVRSGANTLAQEAGDVVRAFA